MAYPSQLAIGSTVLRTGVVGSISYLVVDEAGVLAGVLVVEVQGVTGELDTAILLALDEEAVVVAWFSSFSKYPDGGALRFALCSRLKLTDNLPDQV